MKKSRPPFVRAFRQLVKYAEKTVNLCLFHLAVRPRTSPPRSTPKILITKLDAIGDFVLFTAALPIYRELFPGWHVVLLVRDSVVNLAETSPHVDEVWGVDPGKFRRNLRERWRWYRRIVREGFDIAINGQYSTSYDFLDCLAGWSKAPRRIAFECRRDVVKRRTPNPYYPELVPEAGDIAFEIDRNYAMLHYLGYRGSTRYGTELWPTENDRGRAACLLSCLGGEPYAVMFPGASVRKRCWSEADFVLAAQRINDAHSLCWAICGSDAESDLCASISAGFSAHGIPHVALAGRTTLRELAVVMAGAEFCLGNETSGAHIAVAAGIPSICILGGGHYGRFFPYPGNPLTRAVTHRMPCYNCDWECRYAEYECIARVTVADVVAEALGVLAGHGSNEAKDPLIS